MVLPADLGAVEPKRVADFLADIAAWVISNSKRPVPGTYVHTTLCPWPMQALLFDDARGEPEALEQFEADGHHVRLLWAVPIYAAEADLILAEGIEAFDALVDQAELSVVDVRREPLL